MTRFGGPRSPPPPPLWGIGYWLLVVVVGLVEEAPRPMPGCSIEEALKSWWVRRFQRRPHLLNEVS